MKSISKLANQFNYKLYLTILLISLAPTLYATIRIHFLGFLPNDYGVNIASQLSWVSILYEICTEALLLPLYYFIGQALTVRDDLANRVYSGIITTSLAFLLVSAFVFVWARPLLKMMAQKEEILEFTVSYIRLESLSIILQSIVRFMQIVLIILNNKKSLLLILVYQVLLTFASDFFLISPFPYSLELGVNGIAIGNIGINTVLMLIGYHYLKKEIGPFKSIQKLSFKWIKNWWSIGRLSGLESLIRNLVYVIFILRMINIIQEQGNYWIANSFIWNWLLLPILALGELIKKETASSPTDASKQLRTYIKITLLIILLLAGTSFFWHWFVKRILNANEYYIVIEMVKLLLGFYIVFAFNNIIDSIFYGLGRTDLMLYQSLAVNCIFYGGVFIAYSTGLFEPELRTIVYIFGTGIVLDSLLTFIQYFYLSKRGKLVLRPVPNAELL